MDDSTNLSQWKRACEEWLPKVLVRRWRTRVERHLRRCPLIEAERQIFLRGQKKEAVDPVQAYGATLLAALLTPWFHLYVQLGDGDMLTVSATGEVTRPPLPIDTRLLGNETTSLCSPQAWHNVRICFQPVVESAPALVMLSTDGYANSFVDDRAFQQVGADLLHLLRQEGVEPVAAQLPGWLQDTSASGSGDDITAALALWEVKPHESA